MIPGQYSSILSTSRWTSPIYSCCFKDLENYQTENMKQTIDDDFNHVGVSLDNNFRCSRTPYENMEL